LTDDLRRRDFTINTLALRLDGKHFGELRDDLGGLDDLEKGLVRVLHPDSYRDDPTRLLRAIRYEQRYGFRIADEDLALIAAAKPLLGDLTGERLRHELDLLLAEEKSAAMLARSAGLGILAEIHSSLAWDASLHPVFERLNQPEPDSWRGVPDLARVPRRVSLSYLLWLSDLDASVIQSLASRLDFTANLREALLASSALHTELPALADAKPSVITARLDEVPLLAVCALSLESASIRLSDSISVDESVDKYLSLWRHVKPKTTGHTLIKLGIEPSPAFQTILNCLRTAWLDGEVKTIEEEKKLLDNLIKFAKNSK
jgi:tRNA nucleotidyltransferase (CCA-adding enzyme)